MPAAAVYRHQRPVGIELDQEVDKLAVRRTIAAQPVLRQPLGDVHRLVMEQIVRQNADVIMAFRVDPAQHCAPVATFAILTHADRIEATAHPQWLHHNHLAVLIFLHVRLGVPQPGCGPAIAQRHVHVRQVLMCAFVLHELEGAIDLAVEIVVAQILLHTGLATIGTLRCGLDRRPQCRLEAVNVRHQTLGAQPGIRHARCQQWPMKAIEAVTIAHALDRRLHVARIQPADRGIIPTHALFALMRRLLRDRRQRDVLLRVLPQPAGALHHRIVGAINQWVRDEMRLIAVEGRDVHMGSHALHPATQIRVLYGRSNQTHRWHFKTPSTSPALDDSCQ